MKDESGTNELRAELRRLTTTLQRDMLEGNASDDSRYMLERAEYLAKLLDLAERTRTPRSTRWQPPAILFGIAVVVLALVTVPVRRTNAVINVRSSALAVRLVPSWPEMGTRYDAPGSALQPLDETDLDLWRALDQGRDPTLPDQRREGQEGPLD